MDWFHLFSRLQIQQNLRRNKNEKIVGIFNNEERAVAAIEDLQRQGYRDDEISVVVENKDRFDAITQRTGVDVDDQADPGGAMAGAAAGGAIGGIGGLLLGLGALAIPGVGPIVAAGPIASTLVGALAGGAVGGLAGALVDLGVSEENAELYAERINQGDIMVLVDDPEDDARRESVYDNFRRNESFNKDSYSYADTLTTSPYESGVNQDIDSPIQDDYKDRNKTLDDPLIEDSRNTYNRNNPLDPLATDDTDRKF